MAGGREAQLGVAGRALPPQPMAPRIKPPPLRVVRHRPEDVYQPAGEAARPADR